jgi:hypothetical protein
MDKKKFQEVQRLLSRLESIELSTIKSAMGRYPYMAAFRQWYTLKTDDQFALAILYSPNLRIFKAQLGEFRWHSQRRPTPLPTSSMNSWKERNQKLAVLPNVKVVDHSAQTVNDLAKDSIVENEGLASETLANLFEKQGLYSKSIEMYERLILKIPEKSSYFADKIEKIKSKVQ